MLKTLTWGNFFSFILLLMVIYYLWVMLKYYRHDLVDRFTGRKRLTRTELTSVDALPSKVVEAPQPVAVQPELFNGRAAGLAGWEEEEPREQSPEMFKVMATVVAILKDVVAEGVEEKTDKVQLLVQIKDVLSRYGQLKGTPYEGSINSFLSRTCASNFSLVLDDGDLAGLWG